MAQAKQAQKRASHSRAGGRAPKRAASSQPKRNQHDHLSRLSKEELVERLRARLGKLKKDELVTLVGRVESGTVDFSRLVPSGSGGFGFQHHLTDEPEQADAPDESSGMLGKAQDVIADARERLPGLGASRHK